MDAVVNPHAPLADLATVKAWVMCAGSHLATPAEDFKEYWSTTGRGIRSDALPDGLTSAEITRLTHHRIDPRTLLRALNSNPLNNDSPATLNVVLPQACKIAKDSDLALNGTFVRSWVDTLEKLAAQANVALEIGGGERRELSADLLAMVTRAPFEPVLSTRDRGLITAWGEQARLAVACSRIELSEFVGLEDFQDACVAAWDLPAIYPHHLGVGGTQQIDGSVRPLEALEGSAVGILRVDPLLDEAGEGCPVPVLLDLSVPR